MTTDNAIQAEAAYRTARHVEGTRRPVGRVLVRIVYRPKRIVALVAAIRRSPSANDAARDILAAVDLPTGLTAGRA